MDRDVRKERASPEAAAMLRNVVLPYLPGQHTPHSPAVQDES